MANTIRVDCSQCLELLLYEWGHRVKGNVSLIKEGIGVIKSQLETLPNDLANIELGLDNINLILDGIGSSAQDLIEFPSPFDVERVAVNSLVKEILRTYQNNNRSNNEIIFIGNLDPNEPFVNANRVWLRRLLYNLLDNAEDAVTKSIKKQISITTIIIGQEVKITVSDTGAGMENEIMESLFKKPHMLGPKVKGRGTYIAQLIVDIYSGRIKVEPPTEGEGSVLAVWLPVEK
jgi:C4-dicarboxylate-specific signal transduction histidine kinase